MDYMNAGDFPDQTWLPILPAKGLVLGNELLFREQLLMFKFRFAPSPYREQADGYLGDTFAESVFLEYNIHTNWLSLLVQEIGFKNLHA